MARGGNPPKSPPFSSLPRRQRLGFSPVGKCDDSWRLSTETASHGMEFSSSTGLE
ncbi:hypothetical protein Lalb_Chr09g0331651 [Lupinus albus]|uniref:Uncharacterized protein n=1 Tax=Lupinus albus TaxID=3870 RepID=A0A6A4Q1U2_LUPAL|nr:hypothetical protein Lalb_Chr09g0331651 [Lupinus albus]